MIRYAITNRLSFAGDESERCSHLLSEAVRLAKTGVDFLQLREKDLPFAQAADIAHQMLSHIRAAGCATKVLLNAEWPGAGPWPADLGLHLSASGLASVAHSSLSDSMPLPTFVSASCHSLEALPIARRFATILLCAPVFEKRVDGSRVQEGRGLEMLAEMCRAAAPLPVLAMGGVTLENAGKCLAAGARGIAGIRLFQARG